MHPYKCINPTHLLHRPLASLHTGVLMLSFHHTYTLLASIQMHRSCPSATYTPSEPPYRRINAVLPPHVHLTCIHTDASILPFRYIYCHWNLCDYSLCEFGVNVSTQWYNSIDHIRGLINHVHVIGSLSNCWELESCDWMFSRDPWEWLRDWRGFSLSDMIREWKWTLV